MKKKIAGILAVLMILCMSTTVFAADSPNGSDAVFDKVSNSASAAPGQSNVNVGKVTQEVYEEAKKETSGAIVSMTNVQLNNVSNVNLSKGVSVSLSISTLTADDSMSTIRIMHKRSSDGKWEIIVPKAIDPVTKTVTLTMYEFSPLAIVRYESGKAPGSTQNIPQDNSKPDNSGNNTWPSWPSWPSDSGNSNSSGNSGNSSSSGNSGNNNSQNNSAYEQVSSTLKLLDGEKIIKATKIDKVVYEEAVKETTGTIVSMANITLNNIADANLSKGVSVSVYVSSLTADDSVSTIRLLHKRSNDNRWEVIVPASVNPATKIVSAKFYDFSPVAVVRYAAGNAPGSTQYIPNVENEAPSDGSQNSQGSEKPQDSEKPADSEDNRDNPDDEWQNSEDNRGDSDDKPTKPSKDKDKPGTSDRDSVKPDKDNAKPDKDNAKPDKDSAKPSKDQNENSTTKQDKPVAGNSTTKPAASAVHVSSTSSAQTSPKTGSSMPVLPAIAMLSLMGVVYCGKKAKSL